jgi:uncharacterized protein (TIGR02145 family)
MRNSFVRIILPIGLLLTLLMMSSCETEPGFEPVEDPDIESLTVSGRSYNVITIGSQTWMAYNSSISGSSSVCGNPVYHEDTDSSSLDGRLYTHQGALNCACPTGFHLPTDDEWQTLEQTLGMSEELSGQNEYRGSDEGAQLRPNGGSGFRARLAGVQADGVYFGFGTRTSFWTATDDPDQSGFALGRELGNGGNQIGRFGYEKQNKYSVRCILD